MGTMGKKLGITGVLWAVLSIVGNFLPGAGPMVDESSAKMADYISKDPGTQHIAITLIILGSLFGLMFFAKLAVLVRGAGGQ